MARRARGRDIGVVAAKSTCSEGCGRQREPSKRRGTTPAGAIIATASSFPAESGRACGFAKPASQRQTHLNQLRTAYRVVYSHLQAIAQKKTDDSIQYRTSPHTTVGIRANGVVDIPLEGDVHAITSSHPFVRLGKKHHARGSTAATAATIIPPLCPTARS